MLKSIKKFFNETEKTTSKNHTDLSLLCGLMMEAANIDGQVDQSEVNKISKVLIEIFKENPKSVQLELEKCLDEVDEQKSLHSFTSEINKSFDEKKKLLFIETLWQIILEDGKLHDFESNLIRRLAGLLYISDVQCGNAKQKALEKI